jgi:CRISPR-associated protein Cas2
MLYVVCYDISDDKVRDQMSEGLLGFGVRIQASVFELLLDDELYGRLLQVISKVRLAREDKVRVYKVCARCVEQVAIYGPGEVSKDPDYWVV